MHNILAVSVLMLLATDVGNASGAEAHWRRPVAIDISEDGEWLYTANRDSGTVSIVAAKNRTVIDEISVGKRLSDVLVVPEKDLLLCLDQAKHELVVLRQVADHWAVATRAPVAAFPSRVLWDAATSRCLISSLRSRTLTAFRLLVTENDVVIQPDRTIRLPFEPLEMCLAGPDRRLIVADAFQAELAVVDAEAVQLKMIHKLPGHNIRGLAITADGRELLVAQQELNPLARSSRDDVHWGNMISNLLVSYPYSVICEDRSDAAKHRTVHQLGEPSQGAGDPGPIVLAPDGELAVLLSGVHQIAISGKELGHHWRRANVGERPVSAVSTPDGRIYAANQFADSISVVDFGQARELDQISLGTTTPPLDLLHRGESLFFDARLSHDGWMSCHSCHTDGHTNGQLNDNLSDGSFAAPKRVLSLLGVADTKPWAWNGTVGALQEQVVNSIEKTMQGTTPSDIQVQALVAFIEALSPPPVIRHATQQLESVSRGRDLFRSLECGRCHAPPTYTSPNTYDVSLADELGNNQFNPPSLRGVATRRSYFHDGRATSLAEVFTEHRHQLTVDLSRSDLDSLLDFLMSI